MKASMETLVARITEELPYLSVKTVTEMCWTFRELGGLACVTRWPEEFSMFCDRRNVFDVLLDAGELAPKRKTT